MEDSSSSSSSDEDNASFLGISPPKPHRVQFYQGIDLSVLYKTRTEIIYKLTEIYLPRSRPQREKMVEYNLERMVNPNEVENETVRAKKRKLKEEMKQARAKLKY